LGTHGPDEGGRVTVDFELGSRYRAGAGPVLLTGVQAIARNAGRAARRRRRGRAAHRVVRLGYQGSPLGGLDQTLARATELRAGAGLTLVPAINEELAATAVWGSQLEVPGHGRTVDGAIGVWYGKAPGVDRAGDPFRHGNMCGAHPNGGVLVLAGDDPSCKSSTIPCISERTLAGYGLPVLYPGNRRGESSGWAGNGIAMSRASGMWVGMKITADVADGVFTLDGADAELPLTVPALEWEGRPWAAAASFPMLVPPGSLQAEAELYGPRWAMLRAFLAANPVNAVEVDPPGARLGVVAGGKAFTDVRQALRDLGLDDEGLPPGRDPAAPAGDDPPTGPGAAARFRRRPGAGAGGRGETPFVEAAVRDALYGLPDAPAVLGSADATGAPLVPVAGELTASALIGPLRRGAGRVR
jgi:indolepyruvate ferredoxin oxidoreductase